MSKVNTSCYEQQSYQFDTVKMNYSFECDFENNHTDESIEYNQNKQNNIIVWSRKFINFFTKTLFLRNTQNNNDKVDIYKYYP